MMQRLTLAINFEAKLAAMGFDPNGAYCLFSEAQAAIEAAKDEGVHFVFDKLAKALGLETWVGEDGTETWEGDVGATLYRLLRDSGAIDVETDVPAHAERDTLRAENARLAKRVDELSGAVKSFLHLLMPSKDGPGRDTLHGLPDSHLFELVWANDDDDDEGDMLERLDPVITAGQIRRARAMLAGSKNEKEGEMG